MEEASAPNDSNEPRPRADAAGEARPHGLRPNEARPNEVRLDETRLADLLDRALELDGARREAFLATLAETAPTVAEQLRELVSALPDPETETDDASRGQARPDAGPAETHEAESGGELEAGEPFAGCIVRGVLGRGGTGTVYFADQLEPSRPVALKTLHSIQSRGSALRRFRTEALALARLEHAGIARIYGSGVETRRGIGLPYIVMERVADARSFVEWARESAATPREIAARMAEVCDAMQHGHQRGVLHRDLKPSNVLVDGAGRPRVIDFGVARLLEREGAVESTVAGAIIGTPAYMAPEQFELAPSELDIRIDVHALGVILYEALTGRRAYDIQRHQYFDARRILRDTEPARADLVDSRVPRDLASIVAKAMAKDRARRYDSMTELRDDLVAFLDGRSVRAQPEDAIQRFTRTVRRNPAWFTAGALVFAVLLAATVVTTRQLGVVARRNALAQTARLAAAVANGNATEAQIAAGLLPRGFDPRIPAMLLNQLDQSDGRIATPPRPWNLMGGALSPDGTRWLTVGDGGAFVLCGVPDGPVASGEIPSLGQFPWACAFSPDSARAFVAGDGMLCELDAKGAATVVASGGWMQPRGMRIVGGGASPRAQFFSQGVGFVRAPLDGAPSEMTDFGEPGRMVGAAAWIDDFRGFLVQGNGRCVRFELDADGRNPARVPDFAGPVEAAQSVAVSRDGRRVAIGLSNGGVRVLDAATGRELGRAEFGHSVWSVGFTPDASRLFAGDRDGRVHALDLSPDGAVAATRTQSAGTGDPAWALAALDDDEVVASIGGVVRTLDFSPRWSPVAASLGSGPFSMSDFDGRRLRAVAGDGSVRELDMAAGAWRQVANGGPRGGKSHAISRDGRRLASLDGGTVRVVDLETGAASQPVALDFGARAGAEWSDDGSMVACVSNTEALLLDAEGRELARTDIAGVSDVITLCWHARDQFLAVQPYDVPRRIAFRYRKGALTYEFEPAPSALGTIRSQGRWITPQLGGDVMVSWPGGADLLEAELEHHELRLKGHDDYATAAAFSPDRAWIATGSSDGEIRLWSMRDGELTFSIRQHPRRIKWIRWSTDGTSLLTMSESGEVRVLDSVPRAERMRSARVE